MHALSNTQSFGSMVSVPDCDCRNCQFSGRSTTESPTIRKTEKNDSLNETPSLKDRLFYPLLAAKSRILNMAVLGASVGYYLSVLPVSGIFGLVGNFIGNTLGSVIKCLFFSNSEMSSGDYGTGLGCFIGAWLAVPVSIVLGAIGATAFAVIGLASNIFTLPVDICRAITLDNKAKMKPEPSWGIEEWNKIELPKFNEAFILL